MAVYPLLTEKQTFVDANGNLLAGGKLFVYAANTQTKVTSYAETDGASANSNPIVLNSRGEVPNGLYVSGGLQYKLVLAPSTDTDPPTSPIWTRDDLDPLGYVPPSSASSEWISGGAVATQTGATTFTVPGDQRAVFQVGRRVRAVITASPQLTYGTILTSVFGSGVTTVTMTALTTNLDSGLTGTLPDVGILAATNPSVPWYQTRTDTSLSIQSGGTWDAAGFRIGSAASNAPVATLENTTTDANASSLAFYKSRNALATQNGDIFGTVFAYGRDASNVQRFGGYMRWTQNGAAGATWVPGAFALQLVSGAGTDTNVISATTSAVNVPVPLQENATRVFSRNSAYVSAEQTITAGTNVTLAHGLSGVPAIVRVVLRCKTAELGYLVNEEVDMTFQYTFGGGQVQTSSDATNVYITFGNNVNLLNKLSMPNVTTITYANWRWVVRAWF